MSTAPKRESLRGVGKDAAGPHPFTHRIHAYVLEHPEGLTKAQIVDKVVQEGWIFEGYAKRWYERRLGRERERQGYSGGSKRRPEYDSREFAQRAVLAKAKDQLSQMIGSGSLRKEGDLYYAARDRLRNTQGLTRDQIVFTRDEGRLAIAEMELVRALRPHRNRLTESQFKLSLADRRKLLTWLNLADRHAPENTR